MLSVLFALVAAQGLTFHYKAAPVDNPLKGLVPYTTMVQSRFPHSMEMNYLPLSDIMKGPTTFDWTSVDNLLTQIAGRGHQAVFRIYMEYPKRPSGIPAFLKQQGVKVYAYQSSQPNVFQYNDPAVQYDYYTPDYTDARVGTALQSFVAAMGKRYDGDPRIGFITAGLLGYWGEWHTYPHTELAPPPAIQAQVMDAYQKAFVKTQILVRYPSAGDAQFAANATRPFGYHDESFAWSTVPTATPPESWYFVPQLAAAGALDKWTKYAIGGEIRPEAWGQVFDTDPADPNVQDFRTCVDATHASWLMDSGMFNAVPPADRVARAQTEVQHMGYELSLVKGSYGGGQVSVDVTNRGVAPFYYPWPVELGELSSRGKLVKTWKPGWTINGILPGQTVTWSGAVSISSGSHLLMRVSNPMSGGHQMKFANTEQDKNLSGWLTVY